MEVTKEMHKTYHKFYRWLTKEFGEENIPTLCGYDAITRIERYVNKRCKSIKIVRVDDNDYSSSIVLLIPHPEHGITMMFIPQTTQVTNQMFLYQGHYKDMISKLISMMDVYSNEKL